MESRNSTHWMWAQTCELLDQADRMHRQFFRLAAPKSNCTVWEPPVDVFEDAREIIILVALPGVAADRLDITLEAGTLVLRAESRRPFSGSRGVVRKLEIPYGYFERRIPLPQISLAIGTHELRDGCLILRLCKDVNV